MYTQGYKPHFFSQEYVEKIILENYPGIKVNDITAFTSDTFEQVVNSEGVLYFGFVQAFNGNAVDLSCLDLYMNAIVVSMTVDFPVLTFGCVDQSNQVFFTGWKITLSSIVPFGLDLLVPPVVTGGIFTTQFNNVFA